MILIDKILINEEVISTKFSCDLKKCKGACCTFRSQYGAPLKDEEIPLIEEHLATAMEYLDKRSKNIIKNKGFYEGVPGDYSTLCIEEKDCVFVFYDGDIAKCAFEKAYFDGKSDFRKPISCHLFPIRVGEFGGEYLFYSKFSECAPALTKGEKDNTYIYECVESALRREYGDEWYQFLDDYVKSKL